MTDAKEFVGAALMMDIIHHIFNGDSAKVFNSGHVFRFLFAKYFNPKIIYNLIGFFDRTGFKQYEIVIVTEEPVINEIKATIESCRTMLKNGPPAIVYSKVGISDYLKHSLTRKRYQASHMKHSVLFDYVEYNYGLSMSDDYTTELANFKELLAPEGVIGLTYFTKNYHVDKINETIEKKNNQRFVPFSIENTRLIKNYFELNSMNFLMKDNTLITFLGGEITPLKMHHNNIEIPDRVKWRAYSQHEVVHILSSLGLKVSAWMPSAYAKPFGKSY